MAILWIIGPSELGYAVVKHFHVALRMKLVSSLCNGPSKWIQFIKTLIYEYVYVDIHVCMHAFMYVFIYVYVCISDMYHIYLI